MTDRIKLSDFIAQHGIGMTSTPVDANPNMPDASATMDHHKVLLYFGTRRMTTYFSMGGGFFGRAPNTDEVLDSLASDAAGFANARSYEEWCDEYGYDADSRKAFRTFKTIERQAKRLRQFLGNEDDYQTLLFNTERL